MYYTICSYTVSPAISFTCLVLFYSVVFRLYIHLFVYSSVLLYFGIFSSVTLIIFLSLYSYLYLYLCFPLSFYISISLFLAPFLYLYGSLSNPIIVFLSLFSYPFFCISIYLFLTLFLDLLYSGFSLYCINLFLYLLMYLYFSISVSIFLYPPISPLFWRVQPGRSLSLYSCQLSPTDPKASCLQHCTLRTPHVDKNIFIGRAISGALGQGVRHDFLYTVVHHPRHLHR